MVCNSGTSLVPTLDGRTHHFYHVGIHDALFVMQDAETRTLWNHITGDAVHGPLLGRTIGPIGNLLHMTVTQALDVDPAVRIAISDRPYSAGARERGPSPDNLRAAMSDRFVATLGREDTRRPRMDIGLGVWTGTTSRYYPIERIRERGEAFIDRIDGRTLLVYVEAVSNTPAAIFVDSRGARRDGRDVVLDDGSRVRSGVLLDAGGRRRDVQRPQQMFTRWYGFSVTFPGCEIFGG